MHTCTLNSSPVLNGREYLDGTPLRYPSTRSRPILMRVILTWYWHGHHDHSCSHPRHIIDRSSFVRSLFHGGRDWRSINVVASAEVTGERLIASDTRAERPDTRAIYGSSWRFVASSTLISFNYRHSYHIYAVADASNWFFYHGWMREETNALRIINARWMPKRMIRFHDNELYPG